MDSKGTMKVTMTSRKSVRLNGNSKTAKAKPAAEFTNRPTATVTMPMNSEL